MALLYNVNQSLSLHYNIFCSLSKEKSRRLVYKSKNNPENVRTKSREKRKKSISSYIIGYRNSSKKLESLDQSGIVLGHKQL